MKDMIGGGDKEIIVIELIGGGCFLHQIFYD